MPCRVAKKLMRYSWCLQCNHLQLNCSPELPRRVSGEEGMTSKAHLWHDSPNLLYSQNNWRTLRKKKFPLHLIRISLAATWEGFLSRLTSGKSLTALPLTLSGSWRQQLQPASGLSSGWSSPALRRPRQDRVQLPLLSPAGTACVCPEQAEELRHR